MQPVFKEGQKLTLEKRIEALEGKIQTIGEGLSEILTNLAKIDDAINIQKEAPVDLEKIEWGEAEGEKGPFDGPRM